MVIDVDDIVRKILAGDKHAAEGLRGEDLDTLIKHPMFSDDNYNPDPESDEEIPKILAYYKRFPEEASPEEMKKYSSDIGPMCSFCKHLRSITPEKITCIAFPDRVPLRILMGYDHRAPYQNDRGIQFEPKLGMERAFEDWWAFVYGNPQVKKK